MKNILIVLVTLATLTIVGCNMSDGQSYWNTQYHYEYGIITRVVTESNSYGEYTSVKLLNDGYALRKDGILGNVGDTIKVSVWNGLNNREVKKN